MRKGNELSNLYKLIIRDHDSSIVEENKTNIKWTPVFEREDYRGVLGISEKGEWIYRENDKTIFLREKEDYLYCVKLLEFSYASIEMQITTRYEKLLKMEGIDTWDMFPFYQIMEFVFTNLQNDYWFKLAWDWYLKCSNDKKYNLLELLKHNLESKRIGQRNRQLIQKEISRLIEGNK